MAQKEANIWYFGENAGLDFNNGSPVVLLDGALFTNEGCATISDPDGNLLYYTDGVTVYNRNHNIMLNGTGLAGSFTSTHSAIIVPKPGFANMYYIFTVDSPWNNDNTNGLQYSEVDMTLDNGLGGVTVKNELLETPVNEKVIAILNASEDGYWVVSHRHLNDEFIAYEVTSAGVNPVPIVSAVGSQTGYFNIAGQIKISPNGNRLAVARGGEVQLFDFNSDTGIITNPRTINNGSVNSYGIEFSTNGNLLYVAYYGGVSQYNLQAGTIADIIATEVVLVSVSNEGFAAMQIAPDGKIYVARQDKPYIDFIEYPNVIGFGCNYHYEGLFLDGRKSRLGLPTFVQSFFNIGFYAENLCFGEAALFYPNIPKAYDTILWDFGDGNTSTLDNPSHTYSSPGDYNVTLTVTAGVESSQEEKTITIFEQPTAYQPNNLELCDDDNDGFASFDLSSQNNSILNGQDPSAFSISYYASLTDYNNNVEITNSEQYVNTTAFTIQSIIASVKNVNNNQCEAVTTFNIQVFESPKPSDTVPNLSFCDNTSVGTDDDGIVTFDLTQNETAILNGQSTSNFKATYFTDAGFNNQILNPSSYQNVNLNETIHVRVENLVNANCVAQTFFNIKVYELPTVNAVVQLLQCDDDLDGFSSFNLNEAISKISSHASQETITFYETQTEAENLTNTISNITAYVNQTVSTDAIWARVENINGCFKTAQINLIVSTTQIPSNFMRDYYACDDLVDGDSTNGLSVFDFSSITADIEALFPIGQQLIVAYYQNEEDALAENDPILDTSNYRNLGYPFSQDIYVRVDSALDNNCLGLGHHITLRVETVPIAYPVTLSQQCDADGDGMFAFDTSAIETSLLNGQTNVTVAYSDENGNALPSPLPNPFLTATQTITSKVTNTISQDPNGACYDETTISFVVDAAVIAYPVEDLVVCDDDNDGTYDFDTSGIQNTLLNGQANAIIIYKDQSGNVLPSPLPNPFSTETQTLTARVENVLSSNCYAETTIDFVVIEQPELFMNEHWSICEGGTVEVVADSGYNEYLWSTGETSVSIVVESSGTYNLTVANIYGDIRCETSKTITVVASDIATITNIETVDWTQTDNAITVFVDGYGDYEYSLDGKIYQDQNEFTHLKADDFIIYVRDKNGCGIATEDVYLMYYPKFFTPNDDGYNDTWQLINSNREPNNKVYIFDRYGKLLKQLNPMDNGWDGTFHGSKLATSDYWFVLERQNGKTYRGHFTLKR